MLCSCDHDIKLHEMLEMGKGKTCIKLPRWRWKMEEDECVRIVRGWMNVATTTTWNDVEKAAKILISEKATEKEEHDYGDNTYLIFLYCIFSPLLFIFFLVPALPMPAHNPIQHFSHCGTLFALPFPSVPTLRWLLEILCKWDCEM